MSFPLYKAAISIGVYVRRKSKYHSSSSHTKYSKTGTKKHRILNNNNKEKYFFKDKVFSKYKG